MIPVYEQGPGRGIGHTGRNFVARFEQICREHAQQKRAKSFAIIFYDFLDSDIRKILRDQGAFAKLDRLSGDALSIFFVHSGTHDFIRDFNEHFMQRLGIEESIQTPCIVFFKLSDDGFKDVSVAVPDSPNLIHGLNELTEIIEQYIDSDAESFSPKAWRWIKGATKFVSVETVKAGIARAISAWM